MHDGENVVQFHPDHDDVLHAFLDAAEESGRWRRPVPPDSSSFTLSPLDEGDPLSSGSDCAKQRQEEEARRAALRCVVGPGDLNLPTLHEDILKLGDDGVRKQWNALVAAFNCLSLPLGDGERLEFDATDKEKVEIFDRAVECISDCEVDESHVREPGLTALRELTNALQRRVGDLLLSHVEAGTFAGDHKRPTEVKLKHILDNNRSNPVRGRVGTAMEAWPISNPPLSFHVAVSAGKSCEADQVA